MTLDEIKQINIREYLGQLNIRPVRDYGYYGMYYCPFRSDHNASFKVDYRKNVWYDFGTNEGGSIIDLVMKMENCSFNEAANRLESKHVCMHKSSWTNSQTEIQPIVPTMILPITNPKLIAWIQERKIDLDLANRYCKEIHYRNRDKQYFSIGFRNDKGGYELSSPPSFKSCISPKEITTFRNGSDTCLLFEGFWDFLSYLTIQKIERTKNNVAVLNSVANVPKAMNFLKTHKEIYAYLDNDEAGQKATELINSANLTVYNRSSQFVGFKDLNDYLQCKKQVIEKPKKRGLRL